MHIRARALFRNMGLLATFIAHEPQLERPLKLSNYNRDTILALLEKLQEMSDTIKDSLEQDIVV